MSRTAVWWFSLFPVVIVILLTAQSGFAQFSFTPASRLPGGGFSGSIAAISGDGSTVVGWLPAGDRREAFRWTAETGLERLGDLPGGDFDSIAADVSFDGSVVVGTSDDEDGIYGGGGASVQAFRWTAATGMTGLGFLLGDSWTSATAISDDGSTVVGTGLGPTAFGWTASRGMFEVGERPNGQYESTYAESVSADGSVAVGWRRLVTGGQEAFRWTVDSGTTLLGPSALASGVSGDGKVVIGVNGGPARWTEEEGWMPIAPLGSYVNGISHDGSVIVGAERQAGSFSAFLWTPTSGSIDLRNYLLANGLTEIQDWKLLSAADVSADGRTIVGVGENPLGLREAYIATIPEPPTLLLVAVAAAGVAALGARGRRVAKMRRSGKWGMGASANCP
jgi:probable HAF family extracellular repeat protein